VEGDTYTLRPQSMMKDRQSSDARRNTDRRTQQADQRQNRQRDRMTDQRNQRTQRDRAQDQRREQEMNRSAMSRVSGKITDWERIVVGDDSSHTLVRVHFDDGRTRYLDFGDEVRLSELGLEAGDSVTVHGRHENRQGRRVLNVSRLRVDGERRRLQEEETAMR
ncbi:MAG: hypothetical protein VYC34_04940, partial [Planctomycetota bacterium]|nr:hypothetical protein [Planctomycetota bacterium]